MLCVILPVVWAGAGPGSIIYLAALKSIPDEMYEAADVDGAGIWTKIRHVVFPMLKPLIIINFVGAFIGAFKAMENVFVMTGGGPNYATHVIGLDIWYNAFMYLKFGFATARGVDHGQHADRVHDVSAQDSEGHQVLGGGEGSRQWQSSQQSADGSLKTRLVIAALYVVLIRGAVTMVYPFLLMLGSSVTSGADVNSYDDRPELRLQRPKRCSPSTPRTATPATST